jgi:VanZ family protein
LFVILITIIVLIVYGSLYPWQFHWHTLPASPLYLLFHSWTPETTRRLFADAVVNVALYVPLGMAAWVAFRQRWGRLLSMASALALGGLLSGCVEMAQLFTPSRDCSAVDLQTM